MIIGATKENDYQLLSTSQLLYQQYDLKRVFYSAYIPVNEDSALPHVKPSRRFFGNTAFIRQTGCSASTVFRRMNCSMKPTPNFHAQLDPKCDWALRHMELFPVEINTAEYATFCAFPVSGRNRPCGL